MSSSAPLQTVAAKPAQPTAASHPRLVAGQRRSFGPPAAELTDEPAEHSSGKRQAQLVAGSGNDPSDSDPGGEPRFAHDFSRMRVHSGEQSPPALRAAGILDSRHVRLHTDPAAAEVADAADALAVTVGTDIFFGAGRFAPGTLAGDALIAHEATHARQYLEGRIPMNGGVSAPTDALEQEAFAAAARVTGLPMGAFAGGRSRPVAAGGVGPMLMRWDRDKNNRFTQLGRAQLALELFSRGINGDQLGDLDSLADLGDDATIRALLATLDVIKKGDKGRLGDADRIIKAWNANLDDLGVTNPRGTYKTIVHYIAELNRLAQASMGKDYLDAVKGMTDVRLSGVYSNLRYNQAGVGVHPRAVYFVAAGQIGIDDAAARDVAEATVQAKAQNDTKRLQVADAMKRAFGAGHYIPAGGFRWLLSDVRTMLENLGYSTAPRPGAGARAAKGVERATALDRGKLIYGVLKVEIDRMLLVLEGQEAGTGVPSHEAAAHREPALRAFLLPRKKAIEAVADPTDDNDVPRAAREMLTALGSPPASLQFTHGGGTIDPHGTDHAMGLAFDFYNGTDSLGAFRRNFKVEHWPFIHRVISDFGRDVDLPTNLRPSSIDALAPETAHKIVDLLRQRGAEVAKTMLEEADQADVEEKADPKLKTSRAATLRRFKSLRNAVRDGMARHRAAINDVSDKHKRHYPPAVLEELPRLARDLKGLEGVIANFSATDIIEMLDGIDTRLVEMRAQAKAHADAANSVATTAEKEAEETLTAREGVATSKERADLTAVQKQRDDELKGLDEQIKDVGDSLAAPDLDAKTKGDLKRQAKKLNEQRANAVLKWKTAEKREQADIDKTTSQFAKERTGAATKARTAAAARNAAAAALAKVAPDSDPLQDLEFELHNIEGDADEAAAIEIDRALRPALKSGSFKQWLKLVSDVDRPIYDQPKAVKQGLDTVLAHAPIGGKPQSTFYSGHHWTIAPREILTSDKTYRESLDRDMGSRSLDNLRRVLSVMAESKGGRAVLWPPITHDKTFDDALEARLKAEKTTTITAQELLDQVKAQVVTPYESLPAGESAKLLRELRDRGHYLVPP